MRKIVFILFFVCSFAQSQMILDSYKFVADDPVYFLDNAATPTTDENDFDGWTEHLETSSITLATESSDVQNGSYAIKITCDTGIVSRGAVRLELTGLTDATSYTVTGYIKRPGGFINMEVFLRADDGWVVQDKHGPDSSTTYSQFSVTATTDATTAYIEVGATTTWEAGEIILVDNIVITEN